MSQQLNSSRGRVGVRRFSGYFAVLATLLLSLVVQRANAQTACNVVYTISPQSSSAFGAAITIQNTGTTALTNWTLNWAFANGQTVSSLWNGIETQSGANVTVNNEPYNGSIPAGGNVTGIGFNGTWNGATNAVPTNFAINGTTCGAPVGSFKLAPSASTLTVAQGAIGTDTVTVTDVSPFTGSVTLAAFGQPDGVTATFGTNPATASSVVTFAVAATTVAGTYPITITGTSGTLASITTTITLAVPPASGFTLTPSASALSIVEGASGTDTITVKDTGTFAGSVTLAASGMPTGVTAAFGTDPATATSVVTFTVASSTVAGTYPITITGTSGTQSATTAIALTVTGPGSFTLTPSAATLSVAQGASATDTIAVTDVSPFAGTVTFAASGLPTGVAAAFSPASSTSSSLVALAVASTTVAGTYPITITGTSGALQSTTTITLTVGTSNGACQVIYTITPQSSTAFGAAITIQNTGTTALSNWTLTWTFANGQTIASLWNGIETQSGANVTVKSEPYNGSIPAGGSATGIGFNGTLNGSGNAVPTNFAINGTACGGVNQGGFTLKPSVATLSVAPGASGTDTITITDQSPFTGSVTFAASGMPTGVTATFSPTSSTTSSVVTFAVAASTVAGSYPIAITGTSGTLTPVTTSITLTVTGTGGFTLNPSATSLSVAPGASGTDTITVTDISPFTGSVTFAASGQPTGVTATFSPAASTSSSVVTFAVAATTVAGTYPITITGTSGTVTPVNTSITLTITEGTPANATVTVNQSSTGPVVTDQLLGMNMGAWYDIVTNKSAIVDAFQTAGIKAVRWPGGSWSDAYHWATNTNCDVAPFATSFGQPVADDVFANFVSDLAVPAGLDVALTANYGTNAACTGGGVPSEAAAWVAAALTDGITVSHMTVGNEVYGSTWEEDLHSPANNAATYAAAVAGASGYYELIKAASPATLVGVVVDADNAGGGWDNTVLANAKGFYDFVEYHYYPQGPGAENDSALINQDAQALTTNINTVKSELAEWGTADTPIYVGEMGSVYSDPGKQTMSITQALYAGQTLGEMMNDGISRATWWIGFGGCADSTYGANFSSSLYGWQTFGGYMVFSDGLPDGYQCTAETLAAGTLLPTARAFQLFSQVLVTGEQVLTPTVTGDTTDVVAYAATHSGGTALVLFNRNENSSENVQIDVTSKTSSTSVTETTYNKTLYDESESGVWAAPTTTNLGSQSLPLSLTLTPWSINVVIIN